MIATPHAARAAPPDLRPAPSWVRGAIPTGDGLFLREMVDRHAPAHLLELGVASGVSSAFLLQAMDRLPEMVGGRVLRSVDVNARCYFDEAFATGEAVQTMYPEPRTRWILDADTDARRLSQALMPGCVDLTFIDANHYHPWPVLDLLHVSVLARRGSWVILHDIDLPRVAPQFAAWGATHLYDAWPFDKHRGGENDNVGSVRLPDDLSALIPMAQDLLQRPWEHAPTRWHVVLPAPFALLHHTLDAQLDAAATP